MTNIKTKTKIQNYNNTNIIIEFTKQYVQSVLDSEHYFNADTEAELFMDEFGEEIDNEIEFYDSTKDIKIKVDLGIYYITNI